MANKRGDYTEPCQGLLTYLLNAESDSERVWEYMVPLHAKTIFEPVLK